MSRTANLLVRQVLPALTSQRPSGIIFPVPMGLPEGSPYDKQPDSGRAGRELCPVSAAHSYLCARARSGAGFNKFRIGGNPMIKVSPSILSADFVNLERDIRALSPAGADYVHIDVMDGEFVPNITIGIPVVAAIRKITELPLDVHLMIDRPIRYVDEFCKAGADILTIHEEADTPENTKKALEKIRANGVKAALCIKPKTPAEAVLPYLPLCSLILVMTVEPGFGGQSFMEDMMPKVRTIRGWIEKDGLDCELEVDGGVNEKTAKICTAAGANVLVAGSAYFKAPDKAAFVRALKG